MRYYVFLIEKEYFKHLSQTPNDYNNLIQDFVENYVIYYFTICKFVLDSLRKAPLSFI